MKLRHLVFVGALAVAGAAYGGDWGYVTGCVVDGDNGAPVSQARVKIAEKQFLDIVNFTDDGGCTVGQPGYRPSFPLRLQVDVEAGPVYMPWYGYPDLVCSSYPASPPYVLCEFTIELVPRLAVTGAVTVVFQKAAE